jgi:RND family efflux transporter MFP subunit
LRLLSPALGKVACRQRHRYLHSDQSLQLDLLREALMTDRSIRPGTLAIVLLLLAGGGAAGWMYWRADQARDASDPERARRAGRPIPVRTAPVTQSRIDDVIGATAITAPSQTASIIVPSSRRWQLNQPEGLRIKSVRVASGQAVKKGDLLFELDDRLFQLVIKRAEAELTAARAGLKAAEAKTKVPKAVSPAGVAEDLSDKAELERAKARLGQAEADLVFAQSELERTRIASPIDGFVHNVTIVPGADVRAGHPLTQVFRLDPLFINVEVPQERIDDVKLDQEAEIVLDNAPRQTLHGRVRHILPLGDLEKRTVPVIVEIANPSGRIKAGISGWANLRTNKSVTEAPAAAIIDNGHQAIVFRVESGIARIRPVVVAHATNPGSIEVRSGLAPGDEVVVFNQLYLRDNDAVDTDWKRWAQRN